MREDRAAGATLYAFALVLLLAGGVWFVRAAPEVGEDPAVVAGRATVERLLPDLPRLREALERRRHDRTGLLRLLERLIGLDMKLRQYEQGKKFCDAVVERGGMATLNRVWELPSRMPAVAELDDPDGWIARTERAAA